VPGTEVAGASFDLNKLVTAGSGSVVLADDSNLAWHAP
jgi:hypothetical protein